MKIVLGKFSFEDDEVPTRWFHFTSKTTWEMKNVIWN